MNNLMFSAAAVAMTLGLATAAPSASARDRYPELMTTADTSKDGMVSKEEFVAAMGKMYDDKMAKMMKNDQMSFDGYRALWREISGGQ